MRRMWFGTAALMMLLVQTLICPQSLRADDDAIAEKLLPKETFVFFSIPDASEFQKEWDSSSTASLLKDPEFQPFLEDVKKKIDEASEQLKDEIGVSIEEILALPQGEVTFAIVERPTRKLSAILMLDYGDNKEVIKKLIDKMHAALEEEAEHSTEDVDDIEINTYTFKNVEEQIPFKTLSYFDYESYLVFATEADALKSVIERFDGDSDDTLADHPDFKHIMEQCADESGDPIAKFYVNPIGLIQSGLAMAQQIEPQVGMAAPFLPMLGLTSFKGMGGASYLGTENFEGLSKTYILSDSPQGVVKMFQFPSTELTPPKWVPATVSMYFAGNWNASLAYTAIEGLVDTFQGRGALARLMDQASANGPGIHPKKDVLDLLDGKFHVLQGNSKEAEAESESPTPDFFIALTVKDEAKAKKLLATLAKMDGSPVESREFNGETIYEFPSPGTEQTFSFTVASGNIVFTSDTTLLEASLRSESGGESLIDSADYKKIAKHFPSKTSMISYQKQDSQLRQMYEALKSSENLDFLEGIDVGKLPPFEAIQKYLRPTGSYTVPDKRGALMIGFQLKDSDK